MYNSKAPNPNELPSSARLIKSTIAAALGAAFLLVAFVMPAEYGVDPTGIGRVTGLQKMGEIKMSLAQEAAAEEEAKQAALTVPAATTLTSVTLEVPPATPSTPAQVAVQTPAAEPVLVSTEPEAPSAWRDKMSITLAPNQGAEVKVNLRKGEVVEFAWSSNAGKANFDIHGDSKTLGIDYHGYGKGSSTHEEGSITAAFDGSHGWFWRNRSGAPLTVTLQTKGSYATINRVM
jgi:hypothetical protein